jgi:hypothetical protein
MATFRTATSARKKIPSRSSQKARHHAGRLVRALLEAQREALLIRLACLNPALKTNPGYRSAHVLLHSTYVRSKPGKRLAILHAAQFMIRVLEITPPKRGLRF